MSCTESYSPQEEIQNLCKQASDVIANLQKYQNISTQEEAICVLQGLIPQLQPTQQEFAIIPFLMWLVEAGDGLNDVLSAIRALAPEVEFASASSWGDIRPLVEKLPEPRKTQAECFIAFFEQHHDIVMLESCLAAVAGFDSAQPSDST